MPVQQRVNIKFTLHNAVETVESEFFSLPHLSTETVCIRIQICYSIISGNCLFNEFQWYFPFTCNIPPCHLCTQHSQSVATIRIGFSTVQPGVYLHSGFKVFCVNGKMIQYTFRFAETLNNHWHLFVRTK